MEHFIINEATPNQNPRIHRLRIHRFTCLTSAGNLTSIDESNNRHLHLPLPQTSIFLSTFYFHRATTSCKPETLFTSSNTSAHKVPEKLPWPRYNVSISCSVVPSTFNYAIFPNIDLDPEARVIDPCGPGLSHEFALAKRDNAQSWSRRDETNQQNKGKEKDRDRKVGRRSLTIIARARLRGRRGKCGRVRVHL